jgi:hypothetical protein
MTSLVSSSSSGIRCRHQSHELVLHAVSALVTQPNTSIDLCIKCPQEPGPKQRYLPGRRHRETAVSTSVIMCITRCTRCTIPSHERVSTLVPASSQAGFQRL